MRRYTAMVRRKGATGTPYGITEIKARNKQIARRKLEVIWDVFEVSWIPMNHEDRVKAHMKRKGW